MPAWAVVDGISVRRANRKLASRLSVKFSCTSNMAPDDKHVAACTICMTSTESDHNTLITCDSCSRAFHQQCHQPVVSDELLIDVEGLWFCWGCSGGGGKQKANGAKINLSRRSTGGKDTAGYVTTSSVRKTTPQKISGRQLNHGNCVDEMELEKGVPSAMPDSTAWTSTGRTVRKPTRFLSPPPVEQRSPRKKPNAREKPAKRKIDKENEVPMQSTVKRQKLLRPAEEEKTKGTPKAASALKPKLPSDAKHTAQQSKTSKTTVKPADQKKHKKKTVQPSTKAKRISNPDRSQSKTASASTTNTPHQHQSNWKAATCPCCVEHNLVDQHNIDRDIREEFSTFGTAARKRKVRPVRRSAEELKSIYCIGRRVEVLCAQGKWYKGKVVSARNWKVAVRFDGWDELYDEWVEMDSTKLRLCDADPDEEHMDNEHEGDGHAGPSPLNSGGAQGTIEVSEEEIEETDDEESSCEGGWDITCDGCKDKICEYR
ncbi:hypothetical protein HDV00_003230 [Rhizophlyctis rosea]|nr:hypothetical protein HDV00_003230 [Rhizophlyctis rosea]